MNKIYRKRLRERFQKTGADGVHDYKLLELLLTFSIHRREVKPVDKNLISELGGLSGVPDADQKKLEKINGVGAISAILIRLVKELYDTYLAENMKKGGRSLFPRCRIEVRQGRALQYVE